MLKKSVTNWNKNWPVNKQTYYSFFVLNEFVNFSEYIPIFLESAYIFGNNFRKKFKAITVRLWTPGKLMSVVWNLGTKKYPKFVFC